jgi:hypothetical protein
MSVNFILIGGGDETRIQDFGQNLEAKIRFRDLSVDGIVTLKFILRHGL